MNCSFIPCIFQFYDLGKNGLGLENKKLYLYIKKTLLVNDVEKMLRQLTYYLFEELSVPKLKSCYFFIEF